MVYLSFTNARGGESQRTLEGQLMDAGGTASYGPFLPVVRHSERSGAAV